MCTVSSNIEKSSPLRLVSVDIVTRVQKTEARNMEQGFSTPLQNFQTERYIVRSTVSHSGGQPLIV